MKYIGLSKASRETAYSESSSALKWALRLATATLFFAILIGVYAVAANAILGDLKRTKSDMEVSMRTLEKSARNTMSLESDARRLIQRRLKLGKVFSPQPMLAAFCDALKPEVYLKKMELMSVDFSSEKAIQTEIDANPFAEKGSEYTLRVSFYATGTEKAEAYVTEFCKCASSLYLGYFSFSQDSINVVGEKQHNGNTYKLYETFIGVKKQDGRKKNERS